MFEKANKEIAAGNLWRAREILQGSIPNAGYDCELFERLGSVLLMMGDLPEAGRFLFLSGRVKPEYEEAVKIFLRKHSKDWRALWQTFPRTAKLTNLSKYPDVVGRQLADFGFPEVLKRGVISDSVDSESVKSKVIAWLIVVSILGLLVLGVIKVVEIVKLMANIL